MLLQYRTVNETSDGDAQQIIGSVATEIWTPTLNFYIKIQIGGFIVSEEHIVSVFRVEITGGNNL
jgi:hypothetical protein